jgi:tetratricopeptide (TPR) repeat protein
VETSSRLTQRERALLLTREASADFQQGQFEAARQKLWRSLQIAEDHHETHFWLGRLYALHAGSSSAERNKSIAEFRRAIELQPYGEHGDLARAWLNRIAGRPRTVRFLLAQPQGQLELDEYATRQVLQSLSADAQAAGFSPQVYEERIVDLDQTKTTEMARWCQDEKGALEIGWLVGVSVGQVETSSNKNGYNANTVGQIRVFDPLAMQLWQSREIHGSALNLFSALLGLQPKNYSEAREQAFDDISRSAWNRCHEIIATQSEPALLDEVQIPTQLLKIGARAATSYEEATMLPLVMVSGCAVTEDADAAVARQINSDLASALLQPKKLALISFGSARNALTVCGFAAESKNESELCETARRAGCSAVVIPHLMQFDLDRKNYVIASKVIARVGLQIKVLDCNNNSVLLNRTFVETDSVTKFLSGDDVKLLLKKRDLILSRVVADAAQSISVLPMLHAGTQLTSSLTDKDNNSPVALPIGETDSAHLSSGNRHSFGAPLKIVLRGSYSVVLAPVRGFARWARAAVQQTGDETWLHRAEYSLQLRAGSRQAVVNGRHVTMAAPAEFLDGVLYAPLGNLADGTGATANLREESRSVEVILGGNRAVIALAPAG